MFRGMSGWLGYGSSFGGVNVKDLNALDLTKPISEDMQVVAEVILHDSFYTRMFFEASDITKKRSQYSAVRSSDNSSRSISRSYTFTYTYRNCLHPIDERDCAKSWLHINSTITALPDPWVDAVQNVEFDVNKASDTITFDFGGPRQDLSQYRTTLLHTQKPSNISHRSQARYDTRHSKLQHRDGEFIHDEKTLYKELGIRELPRSIRPAVQIGPQRRRPILVRCE
jgi:hypothetical protein